MIKRLTANFSIYCIADLLTKGTGFLLLPIYTRLLSPEDYGILAVVTAITAIVLPVITLGARGAVHRFFYQFDDSLERKKFYGSLWFFFLIVPGPMLLLGDFVAYIFPQYTFFGVTYHPYISLALWTTYIQLATITFLQMITRAAEKAFHSIIITTSHFLISTILTIVIVLFWVGGAKGVLWARAVGTVISGSVAAYMIIRYNAVSLNFSYWKMALSYSYPLTFHYISRAVLDVSDRLVLQQYTSFTELGIYNVSYQIGTAAALIANAAYIAILPDFGRAGSGLNNIESEKLNYVSRYYIFVVYIVTVLMITMSPVIVRVMLSTAYSGAQALIPWIASGFAFWGIYFLPAAILTHVVGRTKWIAIGTFLTGFLNIILNLCFVPIAGVRAAAVTTFVCYIFLFLITLIAAQRICPFSFDVSFFLRIFFSAVSVFLMCVFIKSGNAWVESSLQIILAFFLTVFFLAWPQFCMRFEKVVHLMYS